MQPVERISYKRIAGYTALVLATLTVAYVIYRLNDVVLLFVLSIIVAAALRMPMLSLQRRRVPRSVAILLLYLLVLTVIGIGIVVLGRSLGDEVRLAGQRFPQNYDALISAWEQSSQQWQQVIAERLPRTNEVIASVGKSGPQIAYQVAGATYNVLNVVISLVAILTLTFYWLIDEDRFVRLWLMLLPVQQRMVARSTWQDIEGRVGTFVRSEAVQFVLTVSLLWLGLQALDVRYPTMWALYGAIVQLIPWIGIPLTLLPAIPMFWTDPVAITIGAIVLIIAVGTLMERVIEPWMGVVGIVHPIVSVLALMMLGEAFGILGMLVALPLAATLQSILSKLVQTNTAPRVTTQSIYSTQVQDLRLRVARLLEQIPPDQTRRRALQGLFDRADQLLDETETMVQQRATPPEQDRMSEKEELRRRIPAIFARRPR